MVPRKGIQELDNETLEPLESFYSIAVVGFEDSQMQESKRSRRWSTIRGSLKTNVELRNHSATVYRKRTQSE